MRMLFWNLLLVAVLLATPVWGEYYQYTDENGVLRFTDNIASVPVDQRPDVKTYESVQSSPVQTTASGRAAGTGSRTVPSSENVTPPASGTWTERAQRQVEALDREQMTLNETFRELEKERTALAANAPGPGATLKESDTYRKQVDALNEKIDRYESQLDEYNRKVKLFNAEFKK